MTSTQAVGAVRRLFDARKAGHAGTLDPLATGILPIALGEATKTVPYAVEGEKGYRFTVRWGVETDTDDAEGRIVSTSDIRPEAGAVEALLPQFTGGDPADAAGIFGHQDRWRNAPTILRAPGEVVELEARPVRIDVLKLVESPCADTAVFEARCGKGTYVRALARDMGRTLGCLGHVVALRRTRVASFLEADAVSMETLRARQKTGKRPRSVLLLPVEAALSELAVLNVGQNDAARLLRGQAVLIRGRDAPTATGPHLCHLQGSPHRGRPHRAGGIASASGV